MQFSLVAAISLLASAEAAHLWSGPRAKLVKTKQAVASNYTWTVSGWSAGCARAGCYYGMRQTLFVLCMHNFPRLT